MAKKNYYAVKKGKIPGIYRTWNACKEQVNGYPGAIYKGFEYLEEAETDVLYIDETLEDGSGVEFCMSISGKYPQMKKIVMAAHITRELAEAKQHGIIDGYVEKPVSEVTLLDVVRQCEENV